MCLENALYCEILLQPAVDVIIVLVFFHFFRPSFSKGNLIDNSLRLSVGFHGMTLLAAYHGVGYSIGYYYLLF